MVESAIGIFFQDLRIGELSLKMISKIENLTIEKLENLGEDFLDFNNITDLENWLNQQ